MISRRLAALALVLAVLGVGVWVVARDSARLRWTTLREGVEFTTLRGGPLCRSGSSDIAVLRIDPARVRLRVLHFTRQPDHKPLSIVEWQHRTGALAVFNAGQFYPDYSYMGLLICGGELVSSRPHPGFKAALVASPRTGRPAAHVLDLERETIDPAAPAWGDVAQSFMLFDGHGRPRIRNTDQVANRTVVGEDRHGRLVIVTTEGGYTLWDFSRLLQNAPLGLSHAMAMDGGREAELCVSVGAFRYGSFGQWHDDASAPELPGATVPLPAVVAVLAP